jgi:hypothetical protein
MKLKLASNLEMSESSGPFTFESDSMDAAPKDRGETKTPN